MLTRSSVPFVLGCAALGAVSVACSTGENDDGSGGATSSTGTSLTTSSASPTASASSGTGGGGKTVTIELASFDVGPGEEVYKCQNFANPFGEDVEVSAFESHMTGGSHHLLLFYKNGASDGPLTDCSGLEFDATPYGTQLPDDQLDFPAGVAAAIPSGTGLRLQSHYLNVTSQTITAHVQVTFHLAEPGTVTDHAAVLFMVQPDISVPPMSTKTINYDCSVPVDMRVMKASSHMHKHGTNFHSTVAGQMFFDTTDWDEPTPKIFDPVRELKAGEPIHFECTFKNDTPNTLTFGESAATDEMCILTASFYPAPAGLPTITCQ
ncbi:MAG: hypothetical protein U0414_33810 [Polyangiaceae bacterium]